MNKPLSLYIHIPFCQRICDYCDFSKLQYFRFIAEKYLIALKKQIDLEVDNKDLKTIYVGGGTPTCLEDDLFLKLLDILKPFTKKVIEYTFEANPESLSFNKLKMMKEYGVNRISLGVESTDDNVLKAINRSHSYQDVIDAVNRIKEVGITNFNIDLILGLPNVSMKMLEKDIDNILKLNPNHISTYSLTIHPHTVFYLNKVDEPSEDFSYEAYKMIHQKLLDNGYIHYEVSNFSKENYQSQHNFTYWKNERYYGIGLGASGYINNTRYKNTTNLDKYLKCQFIKEEEIVTLKDEEEYFIMLNLRTNEGVDLDIYNKLYNKDLLRTRKDVIEQYIKGNYLYISHQKLIATFDGMMILDKIILDLI